MMRAFIVFHLENFTSGNNSIHESSIKNVRFELYGDAVFAVKIFHPHDAALAANHCVREVKRKTDRFTERLRLIRLEENSQCANITRYPPRLP